MATATFSLPAQFTTDAEFRAWGSAISTALAALGLVKTGDTGQIDFTTVTKPTAIATYQGYEIWRFADTLQATVPVFVKVEYGSGSNSANTQALAITVGSGTNGAGTITGQIGTRKIMAAASTTATAYTSYLSGATNRLQFCLNGGSDNLAYGIAACIERTKDAAGADNSDGISVYLCGAPSSQTVAAAQEQTIPATGTIPATDSGPSVAAPLGSSAVIGADVGVFPHFPTMGRALNPRLGLMSCKQADISHQSQVSVTLYGVAHNYLALGNCCQGYSAASRQDPNTALLMRYE